MQGSGWGMMNGFNGSRGGMMSGRGGYGPGMMQNAPNQGYNGTQTCLCGRGSGNSQNRGAGNWQNAQPGQNAPDQQNAVPQMMTEDKVKETAEAYVKAYLPGYSVGTIAKDNWRPLYSVTVTNEGGAELHMLIHGFSGQVMHLVPTTADQPVEQE